MDEFEWLDSLNLSGQWQPSSLPDNSDSMLNDQILDGIVLNPDELSNMLKHKNDDISNALIDASIDPFDPFTPESHTSESLFENDDDIMKLLSSPIEELPKRSIIEDTMERMNLNQADHFSSQISVQVGSSPVEPKERDISHLANYIVGEQQRLLKNTSRAKRSSVYQQRSAVGPIDVLSSYSECHPCTTVQMQNDFAFQQQLLEYSTVEPKQIQIKSQPRPKFRPRTQNERKNASHYLRCENNCEHEYPTICTSYSWTQNQDGKPVKNIIEVTLTDNKQLPHLYTIDNKDSQTLFDENTLIFRLSDQPTNTLYFRVTDDDIKNGFKSLKIEYIKGKQDEVSITKNIIKERQLDQSMLRFTRFYQVDDGSYQPDVASIGYSCVMSEAYGDVAVEHMGPRYGPMGGQENVYLLLKGRILKEDLTIDVTEDETPSCRRVTYTKNGNVVYFSMPAFPNSNYASATANIIIYYKGEELYRSNYLYKGSLDEELANLTVSDSTTNITAPSTSNYFNGVDFFSATGVCPIPNSSRKSSTTKRTKRLNNK